MDLLMLVFVSIIPVIFDGLLSEAEACNYIEYNEANTALSKYLGLDKNDNENIKMRPLVYWSTATPIYVDLYVSSIINVNEKAQSITTQVKMITVWPNLKMMWNKTTYCGMKTFVAPKNLFWNPEIGIMESIKTEFGTKESTNVLVYYNGQVASADFLSLTTVCRMDLYRFPFDSHTCNITLQSTTYFIQEITINKLTDAAGMTVRSKEIFTAQGEWEFIKTNTTKATITIINDDLIIDQLIYQITIKRRPLLYVINFILPIFLFLVLDVMSFFIVGSGTDKLSFKVTLLLSISVFLLILNDTLPSMSDKIPLIGIYCSVIFILLGISLLETILVNFLMDKGAEKRSAGTTAIVTGQEDSVSHLQSPPDSVRDKNEEPSCSFDLLKQMLKCCAAVQQNQQEKTCLCWTRVARIIDATFLILYIITIIVFLSVLGNLWFQ